MKILVFLLGLLMLNLAATVEAQENSCNCSLLVKETIENVSTIYAGFKDKVTTKNRAEYNLLIKKAYSDASGVTNERKCYEIIRDYTEWFKDGHLGIWFAMKSSAEQIRKFPLNQFPGILKNSKDKIEGLWSTADKNQQYAIIKDPSGVNKYIAVTIKTTDSAWKPGMVKVEFYNYNVREKLYRGMYYQNNFGGLLNGFSLKEDKLDHWFGDSWYRESDKQKQSISEKKETVSLKVINKDFIYLKLGMFNEKDVNKLDSLLKANRPVIQSTKNIILDLRGNPGGDGSSSQEMIRLIYTNPILYPAWQYQSSPQLIKAKEETVARLLKNDPYKQLDKQQKLLKRLIEQPGKLVSGGDSILRTVDSVSRYPERVALLADYGSGSSSEFFVFESKQSKKVTFFGTPTAGVMDYGELQSFSLSCGQYSLGIPWGRNGWIEKFGFRVDNIGFKPDVPIPSSEKDWVNFVVKYWSK